MATALNIINDSLKQIGALAAGETADADTSSDMLRLLNQIVDMWSNSTLIAYRILDLNGTLSPGQATYTLGPGGTFNATRPIQITNIYTRFNGVDFPAELISNNEYDAIALKSQITKPYPDYVYYDPAVPLATMYVWPVPSQTVTMQISCTLIFSSFPDLTTDIALPPGYDFGLRNELAIAACPLFGKVVTPDLMRMRSESIATLKRSNYMFNRAQYPRSLVRSNQRADGGWVITGGY